MKTLAGLAGVATLLFAACGGDDDDSAGPFGSEPGETPELETTEPEGTEAEATDSAGGDNQAFCDWFVEGGPSPQGWDTEDPAAQAPPAEIAEAFEAIVGGDTDLALQTEVTSWVTDNCF